LSHGIAVWLDCPLEMVRHRVAQAEHRPLARDPQKFAGLYDTRREWYARADVRVPIESDDPAVTVKTILEHPLLK
jgi:shikimate kinase